MAVPAVGERICPSSCKGVQRWIDRISGAIEHGAMLADEVVPRSFVAVRARGRKGHVLYMKRGKIALDITRGRLCPGDALVQCEPEPIDCESPSLGVRLAVKLTDNAVVEPFRSHR